MINDQRLSLQHTKNMQLYERTLGQWLEHWAETTPDKEYIVYSDRNLRFTWKQFNKRVDDMAKGLIAIGVERGTHVGIWAANVPDWHQALQPLFRDLHICIYKSDMIFRHL